MFSVPETTKDSCCIMKVREYDKKLTTQIFMLKNLKKKKKKRLNTVYGLLFFFVTKLGVILLFQTRFQMKVLLD